MATAEAYSLDERLNNSNNFFSSFDVSDDSTTKRAHSDFDALVNDLEWSENIPIRRDVLELVNMMPLPSTNRDRFFWCLAQIEERKNWYLDFVDQRRLVFDRLLPYADDYSGETRYRREYSFKRLLTRFDFDFARLQRRRFRLVEDYLKVKMKLSEKEPVQAWMLTLTLDKRKLEEPTKRKQLPPRRCKRCREKYDLNELTQGDDGFYYCPTKTGNNLDGKPRLCNERINVPEPLEYIKGGMLHALDCLTTGWNKLRTWLVAQIGKFSFVRILELGGGSVWCKKCKVKYHQEELREYHDGYECPRCRSKISADLIPYGYHPHLHVIIFSQAPYLADFNAIRNMWGIGNIDAEKITNGIAYVQKYATKMLNPLDDNIKNPGHALHLVLWAATKRSFSFSQDLSSLFGAEKTFAQRISLLDAKIRRLLAAIAARNEKIASVIKARIEKLQARIDAREAELLDAVRDTKKERLRAEIEALKSEVAKLRAGELKTHFHAEIAQFSKKIDRLRSEIEEIKLQKAMFEENCTEKELTDNVADIIDEQAKQAWKFVCISNTVRDESGVSIMLPGGVVEHVDRDAIVKAG